LYSPTHLGQMKLTLPSRPLFSLLRLDNQTYATIANASVTHLNTYRGGVYQQTTSGVAITNQDCYELDSDVIAPFFLRRFLCSSSTSASSSLTSGLTGLLLRLRLRVQDVSLTPRSFVFLEERLSSFPLLLFASPRLFCSGSDGYIAWFVGSFASLSFSPAETYPIFPLSGSTMISSRGSTGREAWDLDRRLMSVFAISPPNRCTSFS
jgi:hypothetical protein